jgi:hypothetical protein
MARFAAMPVCNPAVVQAYATDRYSAREIVGGFDIH